MIFYITINKYEKIKSLKSKILKRNLIVVEI